MFSFFKSSKNKTSQKGSSFYHRENLIQTIEELNNLLNRLHSSETNKSNANILFQGIELDSINKKNLENYFGEESFILEPDSEILNHTVYYYRIVSGNLRFLIQVHFIDNQFMFASNKVYSDALLSVNDKLKVVKQITSKYFPDADKETIMFNLKDAKGNILFTHDHVYYYINYLPNNAINQKLLKQYKGYKKIDAAQEVSDTLDRLI